MADETPPTPAKKAPAKKTPAKAVVFMRGVSHGASAGQRKYVKPELAQSLVDRGLARYPKNKR